MLVSVVAAFAWWVIEDGARFVLWPQLGIAALAVLIAAILGKLTGIASAGVWLWITRRRLERLVVSTVKATWKE
jgi:hypothetical protein